MRIRAAFPVFILFCSVNLLAAESLPPAPDAPELTQELRAWALENLDAEDYKTREKAEHVLTRGGMETLRALPDYAKAASLEGKVRAGKVLEQIVLRLIKDQGGENLREILEQVDRMQLADPDVFSSRLEEFLVTHSTAISRVSVRKLIRMNAVIDFRKTNQQLAGVDRAQIPMDVPLVIFIGENFTGTEDDLWHMLQVMQGNERSLGTGRGFYHIGDCPIPFEKLEDLGAGLGAMAVEHRGPARLGIGADRTSRFSNGAHWKIGEVSKGSAAKYAGLRTGDQILRLDGDLVGDFESFTVDLQEYEPKDKLTLDVVRENAESREITLTLDENGKSGIQIEEDFPTYALVESVKKESPAEKAGLSRMFRIDRVNGNPLFSPTDFQTAMSRFEAGEEVTLEVTPLEAVEVEMRGWVGPYR